MRAFHYSQYTPIQQRLSTVELYAFQLYAQIIILATPALSGPTSTLLRASIRYLRMSICLLLVRKASRGSPLQIIRSVTHLPDATSEEDPLAPLPGLHAEEEERRFDKDNTPLPRDACVLEDNMIDDLHAD